ncbi:TPA: DUF371 domain-containing protein [Candidatus Bathyarchaeota archaeon]|nr:DUF371 domain-containing protein [Candidatus Bathyarchaeota archaeon]
MVEETIVGYGHRNISALHPRTLELTKEEGLTPRGDCIVAVGIDKGLRDLSPSFRQAMWDGARLVMEILCGGRRDVVTARGDGRLTLSHPSDIVVRRSDYVCDRTLAVGADKAAVDLSRDLVDELRRHGQRVTIRLAAIRR